MSAENLSPFNAPLPSPTSSDHPAIWDLVLADMHERDQIGERKYKQRLKAFDGRDPLVDLYQELLDSVVYCRKMLYEKYGF